MLQVAGRWTACFYFSTRDFVEGEFNSYLVYVGSGSNVLT